MTRLQDSFFIMVVEAVAKVTEAEADVVVVVVVQMEVEVVVVKEVDEKQFDGAD